MPGSAARRTSRLASVATESLIGNSLVLGSYDEAVFEPSNDLRELAAAQLQSLFQVLRRVSPGTHSSCKACVYARRADSLDAPQMKLQRVACCKSAQQLHPTASLGFSSCSSSSGGGPSSNNSFEELDEVLTLHRAAWEPGSSSGASGSSGCETEALLINEEIVLLPSSNLLVLPLAEAGVLVGLLVVEVLSKPGSPVPYQPQPLQRGQQQQQGQGQPVWELPPVLGLSEDVLWALRMSVPPLAKACAMDLRTALAGAQQEARQRLARSLLLEARGPLKVLGTFGTMLAPRLRTGQTGEPESDMADGMLLQGQRLADVVAQLEAALRPLARPAPDTTAGFISSSTASSSSSIGSGGWEAAQQQQQQPWREPLALPAAAMDDGNMSDEDDSWAFADGTQQRQVQVQTAGSSSSSVGAVKPKVLGPAGAIMRQQQQQVPVVVAADLVPGQHTAESLESSSRDIRWSGVAAPARRAALPAAAAAAAAAGSSSSSVPAASTASSTVSSSSSSFAPSSGSFDAAKTIDLELQLSEPTGTFITAAPAWASCSSTSSSTTPAQQQGQGQQQKQPKQRGLCNVVEVLRHLLSAAAGLAQIQGVNLIVNDPLSLDPSARSSTASAAATAARGSTALVLLPRPVRPLLAGVAGNVCRRVLGYCVDVALQCTPRGGQLCVTARTSSGGVEVSLMHTGQAQPSRLHTSTASMDAAALGPAAAAAAPALGAPQGQPGAAGSLLRKRRRKSEIASAATSSSSSSGGHVESGDASSSSSSRWSKGLQELSSSTGIRGGSSLITLDFARQILHSIGGRLSLTYPHHFMNAMTGQLEVGSNIEVWLPPPAPTAG